MRSVKKKGNVTVPRGVRYPSFVGVTSEDGGEDFLRKTVAVSFNNTSSSPSSSLERSTIRYGRLLMAKEEEQEEKESTVLKMCCCMHRNEHELNDWSVVIMMVDTTSAPFYFYGTLKFTGCNEGTAILKKNDLKMAPSRALRFGRRLNS